MHVRGPRSSLGVFYSHCLWDTSLATTALNAEFIQLSSANFGRDVQIIRGIILPYSTFTCGTGIKFDNNLAYMRGNPEKA